jgi:hypothetical protein
MTERMARDHRINARGFPAARCGAPLWENAAERFAPT